jgi:hypothetical protein
LSLHTIFANCAVISQSIVIVGVIAFSFFDVVFVVASEIVVVFVASGIVVTRDIINMVVVFGDLEFFSTSCSNNLKVSHYTTGGSFLGLLVGEAYGALVRYVLVHRVHQVEHFEFRILVSNSNFEFEFESRKLRKKM